MNERINTAASVGDALVSASRQVWLAGLGAAVVTRDWAEKEAAGVFRTLVREGTAVESRAFRYVGDRVENSYLQANAMWKRARRNVTTAVRAYADTAATLVRETLPTSLPKVELEAVAAKRPARRTRKPAKPAAAKRTTRAAKKAAKR